ncbi:unnamed protein product [Larinioides sclopetarius]|uniref:Uncharacterized protein n=1 Tax=Larinioides sclopetarius TaxID=280406 RepID=A0AAV1ZVK0_9ARAC
MTLFRPSFSVMVILATAMLFLMPYAVAQDDDDESPLQKLLVDGVIGDNGILSGLLRDGGLLARMFADIPLER